jgi:hypothetical protein
LGYLERGERRQAPEGCEITERLLLECLNEALEQSKDNPERRLQVAMRGDAWNLMGDQWKGLLFSLLKQEVESFSGSGKGKRRIGRRGGRAQRALIAGPELESVQSLLDGGGDSAYRLSMLLIHKSQMAEEWDVSWNSTIVELRSDCEVTGVHPVYNLLGRTFEATLGEMRLHPEAEVASEEVDPDWLQSCRIDPLDPSSIQSLLSPPIGLPLSARVQSDLNRLHVQVSGRNSVRRKWLTDPRLDSTLTELGGGYALLAGILSAAAGMRDAESTFAALADGGDDYDDGDDGQEAAAEVDSEVVEIASLQLKLIRLRNGELTAWDDCIELTSDDSLSSACRSEAWMNIPDDARSLDSKTLAAGVSTLREWSASSGLELDLSGIAWRLVGALIDEKADGEAAKAAAELSILSDSHLNCSLDLLSKGHDEVVMPMLERAVADSIAIDFSPLVKSDLVSIELRMSADALRGESGENDESDDESMLGLYTEAGEIVRLARLLSEGEATRWPRFTLLACRLLPADASQDLLVWAKSARIAALSTPANGETRLLTPLTVALTALLDGGVADLEQVQSKLSTEGILGFKQCRRALMEGGDGLVPDQHLARLKESVEGADLNTIEKALFQQLILHLKLNRADSLLQRDESESWGEAEQIIEEVLTSAKPTQRLLANIREQVIEHGVASPALLEWHRQNEPQSMWAAIAAARISDRAGANLEAARSYRSAAVRCDDYELRQKLNKRSLISFAHAGNWPEAIELLESESGLSANITDRFRLYLKVNDEAVRTRLDEARTLILESVRDVEKIEFENDDGELDVRVEVKHSFEDLNQLLTYPALLKLPGEPFRGRVLAAINGLKTGRERKSTELEGLFQRALHSRVIPDIFEVANRAALTRGAEHGLLIYERAMNSGKFDLNGLKQLSEMQTGMFSRNEDDIPVRRRVHLTNLALKPLVVLDTNLLIDALADRVLRLLEVEREVPMHLDGRREFHRTLLFRATQGRIDIYVPEAVRNELRNFAASPSRVRDLCGDRLIDQRQWDERIDKKALSRLVEELIEEHNTWAPQKDEGVDEEVQQNRQNLELFFMAHGSVYVDIDEAKRQRGHDPSKRTELKGKQIYPEAGDIDIMLLAAFLSSEALPGFGSVLVASRDSDFTVPARAFQERFGFAVVDNAHSLSTWTR